MTSTRASATSLSIPTNRVPPDVMPIADESCGGLIHECCMLFLAWQRSPLATRIPSEKSPQALSVHQSALRETTPILARCHAGAFTKRSCEVCLRRKVERNGDVEQGLISSSQKHLRVLKTVPAHVLMRGFTLASRAIVRFPPSRFASMYSLTRVSLRRSSPW